MKNLLFAVLFLFTTLASAVEYGWSPGSSFSSINNYISTFDNFTEISTPSNPAASNMKLYFKSDNNLYSLNSSGVETMFSAGSAITALTGDGTATGPGSAVFTLSTVNSNVGSFGSSTSIPSFTVNAKGLITAASGNAVVAPAGTLSGTTLNSTVVSSSLTSVGTLSAGTWNASVITVPYGGTGDSSFTAYALLAGGTTGTGALQQVSGLGTAGQLLTSNGAGALPTWQTSSAVTGSGTIHEVAVWSSSSALTGYSAFTSDSSGNVVANSVTAPDLYGSASASADLNLHSTSNATKGYLKTNDMSPFLIDGDPANYIQGSTALANLIATVAPAYPFMFIEAGDDVTNSGWGNLYTNTTSAGFAPGLVFADSRGTYASPAFLQAGDVEMGLAVIQYDGTVYGSFTGFTDPLYVVAGENYSATAMGTDVGFSLNQVGTVQQMQHVFYDDGSIQLGQNATIHIDLLWNIDGNGDLGWYEGPAAFGRPLNIYLKGFEDFGQEASTPAAPPSTTDSLYFKIDDLAYIQSSAGVEQQLQSQQVYSVQTTNATATTIATVALSSPDTYFLQATCSARDQAAVDHAAYKLAGAFYNESGTATRQGVADTSYFAESSNVGFAVAFSVSSGNVLLKVTGASAETVDWQCKIEVQLVN